TRSCDAWLSRTYLSWVKLPRDIWTNSAQRPARNFNRQSTRSGSELLRKGASDLTRKGGDMSKPSEVGYAAKERISPCTRKISCRLLSLATNVRASVSSAFIPISLGSAAIRITTSTSSYRLCD